MAARQPGPPQTVPNLPYLQTYGIDTTPWGGVKSQAGQTPYERWAYPGFLGRFDPSALATFPPLNEFMGDSKRVSDFFSKEMGSDVGKQLFERSRQVIEAGGNAAARRGKESLSRAGYGGAATSGADAYMAQLRQFAQAGQLGAAAQSAELAARQYRSSSALNLYNTLTGRFQAGITPAQLQISGRARVPVQGGGPSAIQAAAAFTQALFGSGGGK